MFVKFNSENLTIHIFAFKIDYHISFAGNNVELLLTNYIGNLVWLYANYDYDSFV